MSSHVQSATLAAPSQRILSIVIAAGLGLALIFVSGFATPTLLHNAAHDWRHAHNFPCH
jgi:cobalt transporter subunit CbtB